MSRGDATVLSSLVGDNLPPPTWTPTLFGQPYAAPPEGPPAPPDASSSPMEITQLSGPAAATRQFTFQDPQGGTHIIEGPADATPEQAFAYLRQQKPDVDKMASAAEARDTLVGAGHKLLSAVTGAARGVVSTGLSAADLPAALMPVFGAPVSAGAKAIASIGSQAVIPWINQYLYQPQTRGERDISAAATGAVSGLSRNPYIAIPSAIGGALGQELNEMPGGLTGIPAVDRTIGAIGIPAASAIGQVAPQAIGWGLHAMGAGKLGHLISSLASKFTGGGGGAAAAAPEMDPRQIIALEQSGQLSSADADAMFKARREQMLGPDEPSGSGIYNPSLSEALGPLPTAIAKLFRTFVLSPEIQYQANQPSPQAGP